MIEHDPKKKKRGLRSLSEKMGLDRTSDYVAPSAPKSGLVPDTEAERDAGETVGDKVKRRMTGR